MSFGGGSTSDIGDPRSGEGMYGGTGSTAGSAQRMGMDRDVVERYQAAMDNGGDDGGAVQRTAATMAMMEQERRNQEAAQQQALAQPALDSVQGMIDLKNAQRLQDAVNQIQERQRQAQAGFGMAKFFPMFGQMADYSLRMQANKLAQGGQPVFDEQGIYRGVISEGPFGRVYSGQPEYDPFRQDTPEDDGDDFRRQVPVTPITEDPVEVPQGPVQYVQPAGGFYPRAGRYFRSGLLDQAPTGILDFAARNRAFRGSMATDAGLYDMPYNLSGYTLLS